MMPTNSQFTTVQDCEPASLLQAAQRWACGLHQILSGAKPRLVRRQRKREFMGLSEHKDHQEHKPLSASPAGSQEQEDERRKLRRLQIMMNMVMSVISQDGELTVEEAAELAANAKRAALAMFPDKELAYDILYRPRLQRIIAERFRVQ
jgi:hypothetical protein